MASFTHSCRFFCCQTSLGSQRLAASQDIFVNIFEHIKSFFTARDVYRGSANFDNDGQMTQMTFDVVDNLVIAAKEMEQSRAGEFDFYITFEDFSRVVGGWTWRMTEEARQLPASSLTCTV